MAFCDFLGHSMTSHDLPLASMSFYQKPRTKLSVLLLLLLLLQDCCLRRLFHTKIFEGAYVLSKHLPVFLLGTENVMGGGWQ